MIDNSAEVYMINSMGSSHSKLGNSIVVDIWEFCISKHIWITAAHVPGVENVRQIGSPGNHIGILSG